MLAWLRRRRAARLDRAALVEADADALIARSGGEAYYVARDRDRDERRGVLTDANRPARHWSAVKARIGALTGKDTGVDTATRCLRGR